MRQKPNQTVADAEFLPFFFRKDAVRVGCRCSTEILRLQAGSKGNSFSFDRNFQLPWISFKFNAHHSAKAAHLLSGHIVWGWLANPG